MYPVGLWVLKTALAQCREWRELRPGFHMSANMYYAQLSRPEISKDVLAALKESGLPGEALTIEVTESMQLQEYQSHNSVFSLWKQNGVGISVDDFCTGYSSLSYLKHLDIDEVKIDRCFVNGIQFSSYSYLLLSNIVQLAEEPQIRICCEGIEETVELEVLEHLHPTLLQGYLFSRPCDPMTFSHQFLEPERPEYQQCLNQLRDPKRHRAASFFNMRHNDILNSASVGLWVLHRAENEDEADTLYLDSTMISAVQLV